MGFAGLALLVGPGHLGGSERVDPRGATVLVFASLAWACGSLYSKHGGMPSSAMLGVAMQSVAGGVILLFAGLITGEFRGLHLGAISLRSWFALGYLIVFGSGIGLSAYIYILHKSTAARGNVRVCESSSGAVPGLAYSRRDDYAAHHRCCCGHPHRGHSGDQRAAADADASESASSSPRRNLIVPHFPRTLLSSLCGTIADRFAFPLALLLAC
jgi:EamA-like transporter family protein